VFLARASTAFYRSTAPPSREQIDQTWPTKINRLQVQHLFRLQFLESCANVILIGGVGLGKTHLATALGICACQHNHSVLFVSAIDAVNTLTAAQAAGRLKHDLGKFQRYEHGSTIITTNRVFKKSGEIFNNDNTLTSAMLDRVLHHAETITIEGRS
jgi:DNA replication protein DnaC